MKLILEILWMLIYRQSPYYIINEICYKDLKYSTYNLIQKCYILYFIPIKIPRDYTTSLEDKRNNTVAGWYKLYDEELNGKSTIKRNIKYDSML